MRKIPYRDGLTFILMLVVRARTCAKALI